MTEQLVGASVWEQTLYDHLTTHEDNERYLLDEYQQAAADSQSPAFRYLAALIVEDEVRHHRLFRELAESLRSDAEMRPVDPPIPRLGGWGPDAHRVAELSERLARHEEMDLEELHRMAKELDDVRDTTMWVLLVKIMELDTQKHMEILNFVRRHAKKSLG
jgi:hypothetical protein